jgi:phage shock protein A
VTFGERWSFLRAALDARLRRYEPCAKAIDAVARQREAPLEPLIDEVWILLADVTRYARAKVRERTIGDADPVVVMSKRLILDACEAIAEVKKELAVAIVDEKRLDEQVEREDADATEWEGRALRALAGGNDELAREATARQDEHRTLAASLRVLRVGQHARVEKRRAALRGLRDAVERARRLTNTVVARRSIVESSRRVDDAVARVERTMQALEGIARLDDALDQVDRAAGATGTRAPDT